MQATSLVIYLSLLLPQADWPQFRGAGGDATSDDRGLPTTWNEQAGIVWKTELPGFGTSSPIIIGQRVFLTCYSGYGLDQANPGKEDDLVRRLLCFDRANGKLLWQREVKSTPPDASYIDFLPLHGYASNTPTADNERVIAFLAKSGVHAFDHSGQPLWQADVGTQFHYWGSGGSLVLLDDLVLVNAAIESQSLIALDKRTGKQVWKTPGLISSWSTPVLVEFSNGKRELVLSIKGKLVGIDPSNGEKLWTYTTDQSYAAPSAVTHQGVIYAAGGRPNRLLAIRPGGRGDVTESHTLWQAAGVGSSITSPALYGDHLYSVDDRGVASAVELATGKILYQQRLSSEGTRFYASPIAADGKVFAVSRDQGTYVLATGAEFKQLAHNRFPGDDSICNATPAVSNGQLLIRSNHFLYCLDAKE